MSDQNNHYVPEWVLRKFRHPILYELDIFTGKTTIRNPGRAASEEGLWPKDIEDELTRHDTEAARIYRKRMKGRMRVRLTSEERWRFAVWLAKFYVRGVVAREGIARSLDDERRSPEMRVAILYENRQEFLAKLREGNPVAYDEGRQSFQAEADWEEWLLQSVVRRIKGGDGAYAIPDEDEIRHNYMRSTDATAFARILCRYNWVWLYSRHGFVIGDNPFVRWQTLKSKWDYGIARANVEITMPITLNLCLRLEQRHWHHNDVLVECSRRQTRLYNCRQRLAAVKYVYGNCTRALDFIRTPVIGWKAAVGS